MKERKERKRRKGRKKEKEKEKKEKRKKGKKEKRKKGKKEKRKKVLPKCCGHSKQRQLFSAELREGRGRTVERPLAGGLGEGEFFLSFFLCVLFFL